jgi:hypothetical protein
LVAGATSSVAYGAALSPAVKAERVVPPATPVPGLSVLLVDDFGGWEGVQLSERLRKAIGDPARADTTQTAAELLGDIAKAGAELGAEVATGAVGDAVGGAAGVVAGKVADDMVGAAVDGAVDGALDAMTADPVRVEGGLKVNVYTVGGAGGAPADAIVRGSVALDEKMEEFKALQAKTDENGKIILKGLLPEMEEVDCSRRTVTLSMSWRLVAPSGGALAQGVAPVTAADTKCGAQRAQVASTEELGKKAMKDAGAATANAFAPHWDTERLEFRRNPSLRDVMELHRKDEPVQALCAARLAARTEPESHELVLAVGAFTEGLGYVRDALKLYEQAAVMDKDKLAKERVSGAQARLAQLDTMRSTYGLSYTLATPLDALCPKLPEGRVAVVKKSARLMSGQAAGSATVVAELSKGTTVFVQSEAGGMVEVKLLTGEAGWISVKEIK